MKKRNLQLITVLLILSVISTFLYFKYSGSNDLIAAHDVPFVQIQAYHLSETEKQTWAQNTDTSWYQQFGSSFPNEVVLRLTPSSLSINNRETDQVWTKFSNGGSVKSGKLSILDTANCLNQTLLMHAGILYVGGNCGGLKLIDFANDEVHSYHRNNGWGGRYRYGIGRHKDNDLILGAQNHLLWSDIRHLSVLSLNGIDYIVVVSNKGVNFLHNKTVQTFNIPLSGVITAWQQEQTLYVVRDDGQNVVVKQFGFSRMTELSSQQRDEIFTVQYKIAGIKSPEKIKGFLASDDKFSFPTDTGVYDYNLDDGHLNFQAYADFDSSLVFKSYDTVSGTLYLVHTASKRLFRYTLLSDQRPVQLDYLYDFNVSKKLSSHSFFFVYLIVLLLFIIFAYRMFTLFKHRTDSVEADVTFKAFLNRILTAGAVALFGGITLFIVGPAMVFEGNTAEFSISLLSVYKVLSIPFLIFVITYICVCALLKPKVYEKVNVLFLAIAFLLWLQGTILVWDYGLLDGSDIDWSKNDLFGWLDSAIWLFILAISFLKSSIIIQKTRSIATVFIVFLCLNFFFPI